MIKNQNRNLAVIDWSTNTAYYPSMECCYQVLWTSADTAQLRRGILRKATEVSNIQSDVRKAAKLDWDKFFFSNRHVVRKKSVTDNKYGA